MWRHFDRVASTYDHLRHVDLSVVETILARIPRDRSTLHVADIGCGTGRYSCATAASLKDDFRLFCCDSSAAMLARCCQNLRKEHVSEPASLIRANAISLPFVNTCFDAVITFNAVHHFNLDRFVSEATRILRPDGLFSIYTRTPEQNARTVWGQHFPDFAERETRLYQRGRLEAAIQQVPGLRLEEALELEHARADSPASLLTQARSFHYSTFAFYPPNEFARAVKVFASRLPDLTKNGVIQHIAENMFVVARRE
jgi:ubiquinone/menaquinone biosynthesis C-methylase UbiE